jgi:hypothetical protein
MTVARGLTESLKLSSSLDGVKQLVRARIAVKL